MDKKGKEKRMITNKEKMSKGTKAGEKKSKVRGNQKVVEEAEV